MNHTNLPILGKTLVDVTVVGDDEIYFTTSCGEKWKMYHGPDCCESVTIDSITGNLSDLLNSPLIVASERSSQDDQFAGDAALGIRDTSYDESHTWTFYSFATENGYVDIRWYGTSNGYYSEEVDFCKVEPK